MSQVKFILLGTIAEPKKNYEVNGKNEYTTDLQSAINSYPGAVIFTTFIKSATGKPKNEIYANGQLYSAGGSGSGAVYYGTDLVENGLISNWNDSHPGEEPERGSIYIYTPNSETAGEDIANRTAYYFECTEGLESLGKWIAFTGNVNAENVWFPNGIDHNVLCGAISATTNNVIQTDCVNSNLREVFDYLLIAEAWPTINVTCPTTIPTFSASDSADNVGLTVYSGKVKGDTIEWNTTPLASNSKLLVGTPLKIHGSYNPTLTRTASYDNSSTNIKTFDLGAKKISGMDYGYYEYKTITDDNGELLTVLDTQLRYGDVVGERIPVKITYSTQTNGRCTSKLKWGNIELSNTNDSDIKAETTSNETLTVRNDSKSAVLGSTNISISNTNGNSFTRSFEVGRYTNGVAGNYTSSTLATIPGISTKVEYSNNKHSSSKALVDNNYNSAYNNTSVSLTPINATATATSKSITITGYYPIFTYKGGSGLATAALEDMTESDTKITSNLTTVSILTTNGEQSGTRSYLVAFPSKDITDNRSFSASVKFGTTELVAGLYVLTENAFSITMGNGKSVKYNILSTGGSKAAWSSNGTLSFTFKITKSN